MSLLHREEELQTSITNLCDDRAIAQENVRHGNAAAALEIENQYLEFDEIEREIMALLEKQAKLACKKANVFMKQLEMKVI